MDLNTILSVFILSVYGLFWFYMGSRHTHKIWSKAAEKAGEYSKRTLMQSIDEIKKVFKDN